MVTASSTISRQHGARGRWRVGQLAESKKVATHGSTQVAVALKRAMRVCEPEQEEGKNFIAIHITKVSQVQSNAIQVNAQQRKGNLQEGPEAAMEWRSADQKGCGQVANHLCSYHQD